MSGVYTAGERWLIDHGWTDAAVLLLDDAAGYSFERSASDLVDLELAELATVNYARQALVESLVTELVLDEVQLRSSITTFPSLGPTSGGPSIGGVVVFFMSPGIPFLHIDDDLPVQVTGEDFNVLWPATGLAALREAV